MLENPFKIDRTPKEAGARAITRRRAIDEGLREKRPLFERIKKVSEKYFEKMEVVSAFEDNAGGIRWFEDWTIIAKGETHNRRSEFGECDD